MPAPTAPARSRTPFIGRERDVIRSDQPAAHRAHGRSPAPAVSARPACATRHEQGAAGSPTECSRRPECGHRRDHVLYSIAQALGIETAHDQSLHEAVLLALRPVNCCGLGHLRPHRGPAVGLCRSLLHTCPGCGCCHQPGAAAHPREERLAGPPPAFPAPGAPVSVPGPPSPGRLSVHERCAPSGPLFAARARRHAWVHHHPETVDTVCRLPHPRRGAPRYRTGRASRCCQSNRSCTPRRPFHPAQQRTSSSRTAAHHAGRGGWSHALLTDAEKALPAACRSSRMVARHGEPFTADWGQPAATARLLLDKSLIVLEDEVRHRLPHPRQRPRLRRRETAGRGNRHYCGAPSNGGVLGQGVRVRDGRRPALQERLKPEPGGAHLDNMRSFLHRAATGDLV